MSIHHEAMQHLQKAKSLLNSGDDDALRYAALELRYCIEHLFYRLIPLYAQDLPEKLVKGQEWRPAVIIDTLVEIDPGVEHAHTISFGPEPAPGVPAPTMYVLGRQSGFRRDLARKVYHALGSYLHARIDQQPHDPASLRRKLEKIVPRLEVYEKDSTIAGGFAVRSTFACTECGRIVSKRLRSIAKNPIVACPGTGCEALYSCTETSDGRVEHVLLQENVVCRKCNSPNWIGVHKLKQGARANATLECINCPATYRLFEYVMLKDVDDKTSV